MFETPRLSTALPHIRFYLAILTLALGVANSILDTAQAQEELLGTTGISGFLLEPSFSLFEPKRGGFDPGNSYLEAMWTRDALLSATIKIGSSSLLGTPIRYQGVKREPFGLVEAYAQAESLYGRLRAGIVPTPFGSEGGDAEERLHFPRSLFFQYGLVNLRDYGVSHYITNEGFFTDMSVHNGESGPDVDNEIWFTNRIGWQNGTALKLGVSGSTGRTSPESTTPPGGATAPVNIGLIPTEPAKIRIANIFTEWEANPIRILFDFNIGETHQETTDSKLRAFHLDIEGMLSPTTSILARYDHMDLNTAVSGDRVAEGTLGAVWKSRYQNSSFYVYGIRRETETSKQPEHRLLIQWRMTPSANALRALL